MPEVEVKDSTDARKVQKADREKLRRDKQNEQFIELGNVVDPDRPKNDKASIIIDTIQVLKDLTTEVNRLKAECAALSEEACELMQEKNELREEKLSLKSDIESMKAQYQQRVGVILPPWGPTIDPSSVVTSPPYSFPVAFPVPAGSVPVHPFPFITNQIPPGPVPTPALSLMPHPNQTVPVSAPTSYNPSQQEYGNKSKGNNDENEDDSGDVVTELQLKTPGSRSDQEVHAGHKRGKLLERGGSNSRYTSS